MTSTEAFAIGGAVIATGLIVAVAAVVHVVRVARKVRTLISEALPKPRELNEDDLAAIIAATHEDREEVEDAPPAGYRQRIRDRIAAKNPVAETDQLVREIHAAQLLYRDGVDVFRNAPREPAP